MPDSAPLILGYDPQTLRERVDADAVRARLGEIGHLRSLSALNERVALLRMLGELDEAFEIAQDALRQSRFTGSREDSLAARVRRAQVQQYQGKLAEAQSELTRCVDEAVANDWAQLAGFALQHRGKVRADLGNDEEALADFERALEFRQSADVPADQLASTKFAIRVIRERLDGQAPIDDEPISSTDY